MLSYDFELEERKRELREYNINDLREKYKSISTGYSTLNKEHLVYALANYEIWHNAYLKEKIDITDGLEKIPVKNRRAPKKRRLIAL